MDIDSMIAVLRAAKEGKKIQSKVKGRDALWSDTGAPFWDFSWNDYRVKPEPREWIMELGVLDAYRRNPSWGPSTDVTIKVREVLE